MLQRVLCIAKTFLIQKYFFLIIWKLFLTPETWMPCWQAATQGKPKIFCPWSGKGTWFAELLEKKNQHQEVSWPRGTWQSSILALLRDCVCPLK